jgi:hypothetical protein
LDCDGEPLRTGSDVNRSERDEVRFDDFVGGIAGLVHDPGRLQRAWRRHRPRQAPFSLE